MKPDQIWEDEVEATDLEMIAAIEEDILNDKKLLRQLAEKQDLILLM